MAWTKHQTKVWTDVSRREAQSHNGIILVSDTTPFQDLFIYQVGVPRCCTMVNMAKTDRQMVWELCDYFFLPVNGHLDKKK